MIGIGATSLAWRQETLPEIFAALRAMGGDCIELNSQPGVHAGLALDAETIPRVRTWAADAGVRIVSVAGYNDFVQSDPDALPAEIDSLLGACRIASGLGVNLVRAFVGEPKPGVSADAATPTIVDAFQRLAKEAEALGVILAIENHGRFLNDGPTLASLVDAIAAPNVRVTLDTGNFAWAGHDLAQVERDYAAVLPHTVNVHVKDGLWQNGGFTSFVPAGDGELPLASLIDQLIALGYAGPIASEYEGAGDPRAGTARSISYLRTTYDDAASLRQRAGAT